MRVIDLSTLSMVGGGSGIAESKIPLWVADGSNVYTTATSQGSNSLYDGTGMGGVVRTLFNLSSNWLQSIQFAFESTMFSGNSSETTSTALWDVTTNSIVTGSTVSTSSLTAAIVRSGKFTLIPSHAYGVTVWGASSSYSYYAVDASLIVFPQ